MSVTNVSVISGLSNMPNQYATSSPVGWKTMSDQEIVFQPTQMIQVFADVEVSEVVVEANVLSPGSVSGAVLLYRYDSDNDELRLIETWGTVTFVTGISTVTLSSPTTLTSGTYFTAMVLNGGNLQLRDFINQNYGQAYWWDASNVMSGSAGKINQLTYSPGYFIGTGQVPTTIPRADLTYSVSTNPIVAPHLIIG